MYNDYFNEWTILNSHRFAKMGIDQDVKVNEGIGELSNPTVVAKHSSDQRIGQVMVWKTGFMDFEIIDIKTGEQIIWEHRDLEGQLSIKSQPDFDNILKEYFKLLITSPGSP